MKYFVSDWLPLDQTVIFMEYVWEIMAIITIIDIYK